MKTHKTIVVGYEMDSGKPVTLYQGRAKWLGLAHYEEASKDLKYERVVRLYDQKGGLTMAMTADPWNYFHGDMDEIFPHRML